MQSYLFPWATAVCDQWCKHQVQGRNSKNHRVEQGRCLVSATRSICLISSLRIILRHDEAPGGSNVWMVFAVTPGSGFGFSWKQMQNSLAWIHQNDASLYICILQSTPPFRMCLLERKRLRKDKPGFVTKICRSLWSKLLDEIQKAGNSPQSILQQARKWLKEQRYGEQEFIVLYMRKRPRLASWDNIQTP